MDTDEILGVSGSFGRLQIQIITFFYIAVVFSAMPVQQDLFVAYTPEHRCFIPGCDSPSSSSYYEDFLNFTTPYDDEQWESCDRFAPLNGTSVDEDLDVCRKTSFSSSSTLGCSEGYVYDTQVFSSSAVMEFGLVCDKDTLPSILGSAYMFGSLIGSVYIGFFGDFFGRKAAFIASTVTMAAGGCLCALSHSYWLLVLGRFVTAVGGNGIFQISFIMSVEYVLPAHRVGVGIMINAPYALGGMVVATLAYYIRDNWRLLTFLYTGPALILLLGYWFVPESVRWLIAKGHLKKAEELILKNAKINKCSEQASAYIANMKVVSEAIPEVPKDDVKKFGVIDMLRLPNMRKRCLVQFYIWPCVTLVYYGVSLNSVNIGHTIFLNFLMSMVVEVPAYIIVWLILDRVGRKATVSTSFVVSGVSCLISGLLPSESDTTIVIFSLIGKFGAAAAFATVYVYASEIFPTEYRNVGVGFCSMCARIGGILAPLIASLGRIVDQSIPLLIFGTLSVSSGLLCLLLPETAGVCLPTTLNESEQFGSDQKVFDCLCLTKRKSADENQISSTDKQSNSPSSSEVS